MANIKSAKKRNIQNEKRRVKNVSAKSSVRTSIKKVVIALGAKKDEEQVKKLQEVHGSFIKTIDTAAGKGVMHWKTVARKKSRMAKKVNAFINS